ncbi:MAG: DUF6359 domain-containing protein [Prevotella sp.]|uniref:DUF6359 domain-containing protein n=1 Tax=Prevotella sp. TaxID=59823 RepID=UPI002A27DE6A|nr:DUF6359 domain-containing protein [Prevotella sp.]MDD7318088.1 DUF6359 domain-containing protein [Prevotellaceae bacterium]MDY4021023.1 DUF6359 domain-containing protein [Prevotella sp.]
MKKKVVKIMIFLAMIMSVTTSCEKGYYGEEEENKTVTPTGNEDNGEKGDGDKKDEGDKDEDKGKEGEDKGDKDEDKGDDENGNGGEENDDRFTVNQFITLDLTGQRWVTGYIVGACTKSINNADFDPPFNYPQAILLADSPTEKYKENVISVGLPSGSSARKQLNLVDNPQNYGRRISIFGERATYLGIIGIKKPDGWEFD